MRASQFSDNGPEGIYHMDSATNYKTKEPCKFSDGKRRIWPNVGTCHFDPRSSLCPKRTRGLVLFNLKSAMNAGFHQQGHRTVHWSGQEKMKDEKASVQYVLQVV